MRQWCPADASDREIEAWLRARNAALAVDLPDEPRWATDQLRDYLAVAMPGEERVAWVAEDGGELIGYLGAVMLGYDATGIACVEMFTHPDHRHRGVATELLVTAARYSAEHGQDTLTTEVPDGTAAVDFYASRGFQRTATEDSAILDLTGVDWRHVTKLARRTSAGYQITNYPGGPPEELLASYADAKLVTRHTPVADVEWHSGFEADRLRDSLRTLRARGLRPYVAVAVHTASGEVAGLTELVVPAHRPERADQYDTIVAPAHRGYGLGLAMKAHLLVDLRTAEPQVASVQTWQAELDEPMLRVNADLGFRHVHRWYEYEAATSAIAAGRRTA